MNRGIRSFVLRQGRATPAQRRALDELLPRYGLPYAPAPLDAASVFGRAAPLVVEIGSGMGETTFDIAAARPEIDFLAIEVHGPGVGSLLNRIAAAGLSNLRVIRHDAVEVLTAMIGEGSLAAIHLFFPDPWPKKRHYKRRLVQPPFAALAASRLAAGGLFHVATDWPDYAEHIEAVLGAEPLLERAAAGLVERPRTKFEARGVRLGHPIRDLYFRRRGTGPAGR